MNRKNIIQTCIDALRAKRTGGKVNYLEIGVSTGWLFFKVQTEYKMAVDPAFAFPWHNTVRRYGRLHPADFFEVPSDEFFATQAAHIRRKGGIDVAFVDGLHTYEQAYRDVLHCLEHLNPGGIILMHDCNPPNEACSRRADNIDAYKAEAAHGNIPGYLNAWNGDTWKAIVRLRSEVLPQYPDLVAGTLDLDWGIGYVYRSAHPTDTHDGTPLPTLPYTPADIDAMTYADLERDRATLLGLQPPLYVHELIARL